jgi:hypothetical protein
MLPPTTFGELRYRRYPTSGRNRGPLNGQRERCLIMAELIGRTQPSAIVETGTFLGNSTEWLSAFQVPVFTIESNPESFGFARARLRMVSNVTPLLADSRSGLRQLFAGPLSDSASQTILFYLDAHWNEDLPLAEEIDLVFQDCPNAVVVIDDFAVPHDGGYAFDDYGAGKSLDASYIRPAIQQHGLQAYYPTVPASQETGARRGCVVLIRGDRHAAALATIARLRGGTGA